MHFISNRDLVALFKKTVLILMMVDVNIQNITMTCIVMMKTTSQNVTMMKVIAARNIH